MASRKIYDVVASTGEYTDKSSGEKKKRYVNCGAVFEGTEGRLSIKLDTMPVSPNWSGYFSLFPADRGQHSGSQQAPNHTQGRSSQQSGARPPASVPDTGEDDDIPF